MRGGLLRLFFVSLGLFGLAACHAPEPPLRVATSQWVGYQPLHLAQGHAFLPPDRFRFTDFGSNTESLRAFRNGNVEVAALTLDEVLLLSDADHDARVILVMDYSEGADAIVARPGIARVADLRGKRVGVESTAATAYLLARALEIGGLTTADVTLVPLHAARQERAFRRGEVDALATFEPLRTRLLELGAREIFSSRQMPGEIVDVLVTRSRVIEERPEALSELLQGWFAAIGHLRRHPRDAVAAMAPRTELSTDGFLQAIAGIHFPSHAENCRLLARSGEQLSPTINRLHRIMTVQGLVFGEAPRANELFDDRPLQRLDCGPDSDVTEDSTR
ncbi:MAG TPA: hypothetical protein ENN42_02715 [Thioalkalivibrio sp.]|nr:hypothetical protein [Thioalkalivibrio sp.]